MIFHRCLFFYHDGELTLHGGVHAGCRREYILYYVNTWPKFCGDSIKVDGMCATDTDHTGNMSRLPATVIIALAWLSLAVAQGRNQLPCSNRLRPLPQFAHLFTHCGNGSSSGGSNSGGNSSSDGSSSGNSSNCTYHEWSKWTETGTTQSVPTSQCESGKARQEERRQKVNNSRCDEKREERYVCKFCCHVHICACAPTARPV